MMNIKQGNCRRLKAPCRHGQQAAGRHEHCKNSRLLALAQQQQHDLQHVFNRQLRQSMHHQLRELQKFSNGDAQSV
jgi:hypothetical protein